MSRALDLMRAYVARDGTASDRIRTMAFSSVALLTGASDSQRTPLAPHSPHPPHRIPLTPTHRAPLTAPRSPRAEARHQPAPGCPRGGDAVLEASGQAARCLPKNATSSATAGVTYSSLSYRSIWVAPSMRTSSLGSAAFSIASLLK